MRWVALLAGALAIVSGCLPAPERPSLAPEPRARVDRSTFDFGTVPIGSEVRHVFAVANDGRKPLTLEPRRAECACTTVVRPGGTVAAGDSGWVEVAFDTARAPGERVRTVTVETNDPERPELVLTLRGVVAADVSATPDHVFFGRVPRGTSRERVVEIVPADGVTILKVKKDSPRFDLQVERLPASAIRVRVALRPQDRSGPFDDVLVVTTTSDRQPELAIPVLGDVR